MNKKSFISSKDKKDWSDFTSDIGDLRPKEEDLSKQGNVGNKVRKLDLHGLSLNESNKKVKKFVIESFDLGFKKLLIVTGKGLRSKSHKDPYVSEELSKLRYSVPEYLKKDEDLNNKIIKISEADIKDGGQGAIYVFLKNNRSLQNEL